MIRILLILLFDSIKWFSDEPIQNDLRKKGKKPKAKLSDKLLFTIFVIVLFILFAEFIFICQGTESGMVRNNLANI